MRKVLSLFVLAVIGFFFLPNSHVQAQDFNSKCWTEAQCKTEFERRVAENGGSSTWDASRYFELDSEVCPAQHGYCYPPNLEISLIIPLGETRSVTGLGDYVEALMRVLIGFLSLIIVVSLMVSGLIWMTARGDAGKIKKATGLAGKSFFSLLIVLFSVTLLQLIDPDLVNLNPLRLPLIKQVNYIDGSVSCEALEDQYKDDGLIITPIASDKKDSDGKSIPNKACGTKGKVDLSQFNDSEGVVGLEDGTECQYVGLNVDCKGGFKSCVQDSEGDYQCVSCGEALDETGLTASSSLCSNFGVSVATSANEIYECNYIPPQSIIGTILEVSGVKNYGFCLETTNGTEARPTISCERMKQQASSKPDPCVLYEELQLNSTATWFGAGTWSSNLRAFAQSNDTGKEILSGYCNQDICGVSSIGCKFSEKTTVYREEETLITPEREISSINEYSCISSDKPDPKDEIIITEAENI